MLTADRLDQTAELARVLAELRETDCPSATAGARVSSRPAR
jgi:hypothetical protein